MSKYASHIQSGHLLDYESQSPKTDSMNQASSQSPVGESVLSDKNETILHAIGSLMADKKHSKGLLWWTLLWTIALVLFFTFRSF